jgi:hypothetical protein
MLNKNYSFGDVCGNDYSFLIQKKKPVTVMNTCSKDARGTGTTQDDALT